MHHNGDSKTSFQNDLVKCKCEDLILSSKGSLLQGDLDQRVDLDCDSWYGLLFYSAKEEGERHD